ncbi:MAG: HIG1 domain-containing protein [Acidiferrobacteraceae bacterium]
MDIILMILVACGILMTLGVLATGIYSMSHGGVFNDEHSGQLMALRVGLQGLVVLLVLVGIIAAQH